MEPMPPAFSELDGLFEMIRSNDDLLVAFGTDPKTKLHHLTLTTPDAKLIYQFIKNETGSFELKVSKGK